MPVTFQSRGAKLRVVIDPMKPIYGRDGREGTSDGKTVEFKQYTFQVDEPTAKRLGMTQAELTDALRNAGTFNQEFWELGNAPNAQKPTVEDMLLRITDAATRQDVGKLKDLRKLEEDGDGEQGGHRRPEILAAIDRPLGILTDGKEGKLGPGRPHKPKPHQPSEAEVRKSMTVPEA